MTRRQSILAALLSFFTGGRATVLYGMQQPSPSQLPIAPEQPFPLSTAGPFTLIQPNDHLRLTFSGIKSLTFSESATGRAVTLTVEEIMDALGAKPETPEG